MNADTYKTFGEEEKNNKIQFKQKKQTKIEKNKINRNRHTRAHIHIHNVNNGEIWNKKLEICSLF